MKFPVVLLASVPISVALASFALGDAVVLALAGSGSLLQLGLSHLIQGGASQRPQPEAPIIDPDSGLLMPWYFEMRLAEEAERCRRYGRSMAVVVFKVLLRASGPSDDWRRESTVAAQKCAEVIRSVDLCCPLGPFEFGICLIEADRGVAESVLERFVRRLPEYECISGITVFPDDSASALHLIQLSRERCYEVTAA